MVAFVLGLAFPPMHQTGEFSVDGRTTVVDHSFWPAWIGMASEKPDVGYARNGQMEAIYWDISRSINRPAWYGALGVITLAWLGGMIRKRRPAKRPVSHYPQEIAPRTTTTAPVQRATDRATQPPRRQGSAVYPGIPSSIPWRPADPPPPRNVPPPGGRFR